MKQTYMITNGQTLVTNIAKKHYFKLYFKKFMKFLIDVVVCLFIAMIMFFIFDKTLSSDNRLFNSLSLGAVFATLGSSLVSIATLMCSRYFEEFNMCITTLRDELATVGISTNWVFFKREQTIKTLHNGYVTYQVSNPKVTFLLGNTKLPITIPTQKKDFYELDILKNLIQMKLSKKIYVEYTLESTNSFIDSGIAMWDCIYNILWCASGYKRFRALIILGVVICVCGVICAFLFPIIIQSNFYHVIFTKMANWS